MSETTTSRKLEDAVSETISRISRGETTPKKSGIGKMFNKLRASNSPDYARLLEDYKPVSAEYHKLHPNKKTKDIEAEFQKILATLDFGDDDIDGNGELLPAVKKNIIKSVSRKIDNKNVPHKIKELTKKEKQPRNRQMYKFNGSEYGKGPLVLEIVKTHAKKCSSMREMKDAFPDELLRSYGIFKPLDAAREASKQRKRYFLKDSHIIQLDECQIAVCNQFTSDNIGPFLERARSLGYVIE